MGATRSGTGERTDGTRVTADTPSDLFERRHAATDRASIVVVPERRLLAIDGVGSPSASGYRMAADTLRTAAEILRAALVRTRRLATNTGILECAWWMHPEPAPDEMAELFADRSSWHWQAMIEISAEATDEEALAAIDETRRRAGRATSLIRLIRVAEGRSAQILHAGGPETEAVAVARLYEAIRDAGLRPHGHLHELHLADPGRVPEARARTILRLPVGYD
jgi:hypothetical protein